MGFAGFRRADGTVGVRNKVLVLSSVSCANGVVEAIGREVPEVTAVTHTEGCGRGPDDVTMALRTLVGAARHPNVSAALVVGLGCEVIQASAVAQQASAGERRVEWLGIQDSGGTPAPWLPGWPSSRTCWPPQPPRPARRWVGGT